MVKNLPPYNLTAYSDAAKKKKLRLA